MQHQDRLVIFRSLNTPRQPNTAINDERLQSQKLQVIDAIHEYHDNSLKILGFEVAVLSAGNRPRRVAGVNGA